MSKVLTYLVSKFTNCVNISNHSVWTFVYYYFHIITNNYKFWDVEPLSLAENVRRFRGAYWLYHGDDRSKYVWNVGQSYNTTRRIILENSHFHTCRRENLKSCQIPTNLRKYSLHIVFMLLSGSHSYFVFGRSHLKISATTPAILTLFIVFLSHFSKMPG
jgi:hypothetical protein